MEYSTLFNLNSTMLKSEAEVETRLLAKLFNDLGYTDEYIVPKKHIPPVTVNEGSKKKTVEVDFFLLGQNKKPRVIVEAKDPKVSVASAWGRAASYALSYNRNKPDNDRIKWLLISNGHITCLYPHDSDTPVVTVRLSDFSSGAPPYVTLRTYLKFKAISEVKVRPLVFESIAPDKLNQLFFKCHDLVWKKEKLAPTDAFFEFCKFIFIKINLDKIREELPQDTPTHLIPLTLDWLKAQETTSKHPVRDILFADLHSRLEEAIIKDKKKRIFEKGETLKLSASTCKELIKEFQSVNLSSIDEDLNGRMFEVFLTAAIRGRALGQYFTPRPVVDFMTRIALRNFSIDTPPKIIDACCGTAGFLIEAMAYMISGLREDTRLNKEEKVNKKELICNSCLYGIDANERVARIARINMYLHGDGGSHIYHGDGLDIDPVITEDMKQEKRDEIEDLKKKVYENTFDIILSNPPFSMTYVSSNDDEERILKQHELTRDKTSAKSSILFLNRYYELLKPGGEMLIVLDDTVLNGSSLRFVREWILQKFVILSIHSLPFNAFFKAEANIKTSILHVRKKVKDTESQGYIFMSIANNIGHDNSLNDTPFRNNLTDILTAYLEWQRTGHLTESVKNNHDPNEILECPQQYWLIPPEELTVERFDTFFYAPDLKNVYRIFEKEKKEGTIDIIYGRDLKLIPKLTKEEKKVLIKSGARLKYIEISDVTSYGLITTYREDTFDMLPTRGEYQIKKWDLLVAINNSSRGTVVLVPEQFDGAICTSGFIVIRPSSIDKALLLWYSLRSEFCRKQIYYLAQTASQPELKIDAWNAFFQIPIPVGKKRLEALKKAKEFNQHLTALLHANNYRFGEQLVAESSSEYEKESSE